MNLMDLFVKISVDDQASSKISNITSAIGRGLSSAASLGTSAVSGTAKVIGSTLANAAKVGATAIGLVSTAVIKLGTDAVKSYAEYEQLVGGVETLFKDSADIVEGYASEAYRTAGLSANQYMETVTSFSASLLQSLEDDTEAAAEYANQALTDMSDNANKMGTSMEMIQNAYQGFAKANYTMLDNLKLGYGGTKTEMERLIKDANRVKEANGEMADLSIESFADVVEAIHIIQTEMEISGISIQEYNELVASGAMTQEEAFELLGTTAKEATKTISGSANAMKASWRNLMTAFAADNKNVKKAISEFAESAKTFSDNLLPRIEETLEGMAEAVEELTPVIGDAFEVLFNSFFDFLPKIVDLGEGIVSTLVQSIYNNQDKITTATSGIINAIVSFISNETPKLIQLGADIMLSLIEGLASNPTGIIKAVSEAMNSILNTVFGFTEKMQEPGNKIMEELANGFDLYDMANKIGQIIANIVLFLSDNAPLIVDMGFELLGGLINGLTAEGNIERFVSNITKLVQYLAQKIIDNKEEIVASAVSILERLASALDENKTIQAIINAIVSVVGAITGEFTKPDNLTKLTDVGSSLLKSLGEGISGSAGDIIKIVFDLLINLVKFILSPEMLKLMADVGTTLAMTVVEAFMDMLSELFNWTSPNSDVAQWFRGEDPWNDLTEGWTPPSDIDIPQEMLDRLITEGAVSPQGTSSGGNVYVTQNIYSEAQTSADLMEEALYAQQRGLALN